MSRILASILLSVPLLAFGAEANDASFFKHAAEGGMAEVQDGQLAQQKGNSQDVKDFGAMMVKDHSAANDKLMGIASAQNVSLPSSPSVMQAAEHKKLDLESGDTFDKAYINGQIKAHVATVRLFKKEIASGTDQQAKDFATATLPTLQGHLTKIRQIASDHGITTSSKK